MSKKNTRPNPGEGEVVNLGMDPETMQKVAAVGFKIRAEGFMPAQLLVDEFGADIFTKAKAILHRTHRFIVEVRRPWKDGQEVVGYEWGDRRFSKSQKQVIAPHLLPLTELSSGGGPRYTDYVRVDLRCRFTMPVLGGIPSSGQAQESVNLFERDMTGAVIIQRFGLRAMMMRALPLIGKEASIAKRIGFETVRLPDAKVTIKLHAVTDLMTGEGLGYKRSEMVDAGTEFVISARVPTSTLSEAEYIQAIREAGKCIALSPGRSAGYGDFEVEGPA